MAGPRLIGLLFTGLLSLGCSTSEDLGKQSLLTTIVAPFDTTDTLEPSQQTLTTSSSASSSSTGTSAPPQRHTSTSSSSTGTSAPPQQQTLHTTTSSSSTGNSAPPLQDALETSTPPASTGTSVPTQQNIMRIPTRSRTSTSSTRSSSTSTSVPPQKIAEESCAFSSSNHSDSNSTQALTPSEQSEAQRRLEAAVKKNDLPAVRAALRSGGKANDGDAIGFRWTPLHDAATRGFPELVRCLLEAGGDVHSQDALGWTPLHPAAFQGHLKVVQLLVEAGADVNLVDRTYLKDTPLKLALVLGSRDVADYLRSVGAKE